MERGRAGGSVAVLLLAAAWLARPGPADAQLGVNDATFPLYQVHGSGTSNPALLIWKARPGGDDAARRAAAGRTKWW